MSASRWREDRGLTLPIVALLIGTLVLMVSFAVDLGRQRSDRRLAQAGADVVALDMMRVVQGRTFDQLINDPAVAAEVSQALDDSASRNDFENAVGKVVDSHEPRITALVWGVVPVLTDGGSFRELHDGNTTDLATSPTAVKIITERTTEYFFQPGSGGVTREAIAAFPQPTVDLEVGALAAGFQPSIPSSATLTATVQALNARLAAQLGVTIPNPGTAGFDLIGYRGLAAADVELRRVAANAGFASANEMLTSDMTVGQFFSSTATALDQQAAEGDPNAANAATQLRRFESQMQVSGSGQMQLGQFIQAEQGGEDAAATSSVNVLDLLAGGASVIDGDHFASYQLSPGIAGVAVANVQQYVVRPPTFRPGLGLHGVAENTQARFQINLQVAPLAGMSSPVTIPLIVEAANAVGVVDRLDCVDPNTASEAEIDVTTSGARVQIGTTSDLQAETLVVTPGVLVQGGANLLNSSVLLNLGLTPLQILGLNLNGNLTATGSATVLGGFSEHDFLPNQDPVPYQRAPGGVGAATIGSQLSSSLSATLGSSVLNATATNALRNQLAYVFNDLQSLILDPILQQAGVSIAGADIKATNETCEGFGLRLIG